MRLSQERRKQLEVNVNRTHGDRANTTDKIFILKKEVDSLKKESARLKKELKNTVQLLNEANNMLLDKKTKTVQKNVEICDCDLCGKGTYLVTKFKLQNGDIKKYLQCPLCDHRKAGK